MIHFQRLLARAATLLIVATTMMCLQCSSDAATSATTDGEPKVVNIPTDIPWSERMARSVMKRHPQSCMIDSRDVPHWNYTQGLVLSAILDVWEATETPDYLTYARGYADTMILADGTIHDYDMAKFNIDHIAPGPYLLKLYAAQSEPRLLTAVETLLYQLEWQPRTTDGGYWHKLRYPWQMWLDGLFMGEPFLAMYAATFDKPAHFDHIAEQFFLAEQHTRDAETGLLYHGWDESRIQRWSDPETGCSPHFWARAIGWYCMGLVDVLEHFPEDHAQHPKLVALLQRTLDAVLEVQDAETATWWQVLDLPEREGNYLESTASCMFSYALLKGANEGWLSPEYGQQGRKSFEGILEHFIRTDTNGEIHLTECCSVAGLGGDPYRDGSFEYYIGEPIRDNDPKGVGPFIKASLEYEKKQFSSKI